MKTATKSWKTTAAAIAGVLSAVLVQVQYGLDGDPATVVDLPSLVPVLTVGVGLLFARDSDVSSEEAGAA